jgi:hypothetical protein
MKITLSKNQWELIGNKTGWFKTSAHGDKRDYPKIEIFVGGKYRATTTWAKSCKEAKEKFLEKNPDISPSEVKCEYKK